MKKLFAAIITNLVVLVAFCQAGQVNQLVMSSSATLENSMVSSQEILSQPLDSNEAFRQVKDGFVLQAGHLNLAINGYLIPQRNPVTLKNGSIVMTDGVIRMTNGTTPLLRDGDFIDLSGNIRPLNKQWNN